MKRFALLAMTALLVLAFSACNEVERESEIRSESFTLPAQYRLEVDTFNGSIRVTEGKGPQVIVVATISQPQQLEYDAHVEGDTLKITATVIKEHTRPSPGVALEITAPPNAVLDLRSSNGWIEVFGVGSGGELETSNGRITLERVEGLFVLNTSNGLVTLSGVRGSFGVETSNGSIQFDGALDPDTNTQLRTSNGSINMVVGPDANIEIDAQASNGDVSVAYPLNNASVSDEKIVGTLGTGSSKLRLRTSNGNINVR
ncbi:MAG: DUF4097 family beta strand repeat-containing protein [Chloroflexi bacterium]|nr:DUF4097 family beta strand repeat-containing protein [Chloroflexota bacterium]